MPFCLMWANENWTRRWDGAGSEVLVSQDYHAEDDEAMVADFARHFADPRYIRVQGRPLLMIYRPALIPDAAAKVARWRRMFRDHCGEEPLLVMAQSFDDTDPRPYGLDGAIEFPPHKLIRQVRPVTHDLTLLDEEFKGKAYDYDDIVRVSLQEPPPPFPLIKTAMPSWDNDARRQGSGDVVTGSTPAKYEAWLRELVQMGQRQKFFGDALICVNAWNEWCEGAYLEPDVHFGAAYLNATARAVCGISDRSQMPRPVLTADDASPG
jgi:lipopolysaccharide biosynthesis protein